MPTTYPVQQGRRFAGATQLVVVVCTCGMPFAIPEALNRSALAHRGAQGWQITCPLGHSWHYTGQTEEEKLRDRLEIERRRSGRLAAQRDQAEASRRGQKAAATRARNQRDRARTRVAAGVCPCCNRTFKQLARHMAGQHPGYGPLREGDADA